MATDELLELFSLDEGEGSKAANGSSSTESDGPKAKRRKTTASSSIPGVSGAAGAGGEKWCVEDLWDNSQYEEQHSIAQFLRKSNL